MSLPTQKKAVYDDLYNLPENVTGEIIEGELYAFPRPHYRHGNTLSVLGSELIPPYRFGRGGGPGGWVIIIEPEIMLGENLLVPDITGWKQERLSTKPEENWISVVPDWIGEVLSPSTFLHDRTRKMDIYAHHGIPYLWFIDPIAKILETYKLQNGKWLVMKNYAANDKVRVEPFQEIEIDLSHLWWAD